MDQVWISKAGGPEVLEVRSAPDPEPKAGEVRVRVAAAGVNFADLMARMGLYPDAPPIPCVVGYEVSGTIDAVGEGVSEERLGQAVVGMTRFGGYSSMVCVPADQLARLPEGVDLVEAAAMPVVYLTSWMMLEVMGRVREGDRVLVHSAGGGVGLAALDLLKWRGAHAVGLASPGKHDFLRERGYDELYSSRDDRWIAELGRAEGFDLVLDPVGGKSWRIGLDLLRAGGRLVCFGFSANVASTSRSVLGVVKNLSQVPWLDVNPITLMNHNKGILGVNMGHLWDERNRVRTWLDALVGLWTEGKLRPHVHATVPFSEAGRAHRMLHDRENFGKVLLTP